VYRPPSTDENRYVGEEISSFYGIDGFIIVFTPVGFINLQPVKCGPKFESIPHFTYNSIYETLKFTEGI
jgi:hypothetical protein